VHLFGNHGLWLALVLQLCLRAGTLTLGWKGLVRDVERRGSLAPVTKASVSS